MEESFAKESFSGKAFFERAGQLVDLPTIFVLKRKCANSGAPILKVEMEILWIA